MRRLLELNPDILKIPNVKKEIPDIFKRLKNLMKEIEDYSMEDRFELGVEISREISLDENVLNFLVSRADGAFISGILSGILRARSCVKLRVKRRLNYMGYRLRKGRIVIVGDVGTRLGYEMEGGEIVVEGNAGNWVGERMKGGAIIVKGNVGSFLGLQMEGGKIVVEGNARYGVGEKMLGGEIFVKGNVGKDAGRDMRGGVIRIMGKVESFGYRGAGKVYYWKDGRWNERDVDYYIYYK